jgi:hypothetical protein
MPPLPFTPQVLQGRELELVQELFATTEQAPIAAPPTTPVDIVSTPILVPTPAAGDDLTAADVEVAELATEADTTAESAGEDVSDVTEDAELAQQPPSELADENVTDQAADVSPEPENVPSAGESATAPDWPAPYVRILGPVDVLHLGEPDRLPGRGFELLAFLNLSAPVNGTMLQQAFWPDTVKAKDNQRKLVRLVRNALGAAPNGEQLFPENKNQEGYQLHPVIRSDWDDFRRLIGDDLSRTSNEDLVAAIRLVRGTPFAGISTRRGWWAWISVLQEELIAAVMDAADELARRALEIRDGNQARYAAGVAKAVEPLNEAGWRTELRAAMQDRDTDEINRIVDEMYARVGGGDPDYELDQETAELVDAATR